MAYGLIIKNAAGNTVLDTSSMVLNYEEVVVGSQTIPAGASVDVTVDGGDDAAAIETNVMGGGSRSITTTRSTDTITFTNTSSTARTVEFELFRLK